MVFKRGWLLIGFLFWTVESKQSASFYGQSYIQVPFHDASSSTELQLEFKSQLSYGLLFLAAGSTDYVAVELKSGLVEVRLDLGSGEALLHSQPGLRLDDLQWHSLKLIRTNGNVDLTIDGILTSSTQTKGQFFELNIQQGLFLGGTGNFAEAPYGTFRNYRGCISDVMFNGYDILHAAKHVKNPLQIFEIFWECDSIFDATSDQSVSFLEDTSFLAFPALHIRKSGTFSCDFKTREESAIILYNPGIPSSQDYIAAEITEGKLKVSLDKGNGAVHMLSDAYVSDGLWHQIDMYITSTSLEVTLDGKKKMKRFNLGESKYINLGGHLFLGGLGFKVRANAIRQGLSALQGQTARTGSMKGCLRNVVVNSRVFGFRDVQISRGIDSGCVWEFPCASNPCVPTAQCSEIGRDQFRCVCDEVVCTKASNKPSGSIDVPPEKILLIQSVKGLEGAENPITTNHIEVAFEYNDYRIRESAIVFHVLVPPKYGRIEVQSGRRNRVITFSLLDLLNNKVVYLHDGTDTEADDVTLEMEIMGNYPNLPSTLREKYAFVLPITIQPRNDPPKVKLPPDDTLRIARNSKLTITNDLLYADDPDTEPKHLVYSVIYQDKDNGFFERSNQPGKSINMFTQADINSGQIQFYHQGDASSYLRLGVSDGTTEGAYSDLKISASPLQLRVTLNTGLVLAHGTSQLIHKDNLTTDSNVPSQGLEIKYIIKKSVQNGEIQRLKAPSNIWVKVNEFLQTDIERAHVRYVHLDISNLTPSDEFQFIVAGGNARTPELTFKITFVRVQVEVDMSSKLVLKHISQKILSQDDLRIITNAESLLPKDILITVNNPPSQGKLFRKLDPSPASPHEELRKGDEFTQQEIVTGMIGYKVNNIGFETVEDYLDITVSALGAQEAKFTLKVRYIPEETDVQFINNGLAGVAEGGQAIIEQERLYAQSKDTDDFKYVIIEPVKHGSLLIIDPRSSTVKESNITEFSNKNIVRRELVYRHDDSENSQDTFVFITSPVVVAGGEEQEITELTGTFEISMTMRNDNPPRRAVDKIFQVVTNKEKIITIEDLAFCDPDIEYDQSQLLYKRQKIRNGEIVHATNGSVLQQFTQQDILDGVILFRHKGKAHARAPIWVTDGQYYTTELFEIVAMDPFVILVNNTGIHLNQGQMKQITTFNLSIETNMNVKAEDIRFIVSNGPSSGKLIVGTQPVSVFTWADIKIGALAYKHEGNRNLSDKFDFMVDLGEAQAKGTFSISVLLASQLRPPKVVHNNLLEVDEGLSGTIEEGMLQVSHPDTPANEIEFTVIQPPSQGRLKVIGFERNLPVTFTQEEINNRKVRYYQTASGKTSDKFIFDVTNGFQSLKRLEFFIDIIPKNIPVTVKNFTVIEGEQFTLSSQNIHVKSKHFKDTPVVYHISKQPESGFLQLSTDQHSVLSDFDSTQIQARQIVYFHDGNETYHDEFTIVAKIRDTAGKHTVKRSQPTTIFITVEPVNDQPPRITTNKGLQIWKGAMKLITSNVLSATDPDSEPEDIVYRVNNPSNGHVAHVNNTYKRISTFTQALINSNQIAFVHSGAEQGSFQFQASDGVNKDIRRTFSVMAAPLLLMMKNNNPLEAYPNTIQPINQLNLCAQTNEPNQTRAIMYNFDTNPRHGRIVTMMSGRSLAVTSFSQEDINQGKIHYQHTGYMRGWSQKDYMMLEVTTLYAEPIRRQRFDIQISYANLNSENQNQLIHFRPLSVREGGEGYLTREHLDVTRFTRQLESVGKRVTVDFIINSMPRHGYVTIKQRRASINSKFHQSDIDQRVVGYHHDDSDSELDGFQLSLAIVSSTEGNSGSETSYLNNLFNISIQPVNDEPFNLVTQSPSIQVVQGFSVNITRDHLLTVDRDTKDSELIYTIINPPKNGKLMNNDRPGDQLQQFSQEDLNEHKISFVSDGGKEPGAFYFKVSDGVARPYFKNFNIRVIPLKVTMKNNVPVKIVQSESSVYLSQVNLDVETNGLREDVLYSVSRQPQFGKLYRGDKEVFTFNQTDVDNKHILYVQTDMSSGVDQFTFNVAIGDSVLVKQKMNVSVIPLVNQSPFQAPAGSEVAITMFTLDASKLATISGDNPNFDIVRGPKHGKITITTRKKRDSARHNSFKEVNSFTHEDIIYGKVYYVANPVRFKRKINDSFVYILSAYNVQPAQGVFEITVEPTVGGVGGYPAVIPLYPDGGVEAPVGGRGKSGNGTGPNVLPDPELVSPSISTDHLLIIIFVCLIVLVIAVVLIVFFLWKRRKQKKEASRMKQRPKPRPFISDPLPLNQPNVHIEPSQQHSSPASDDEQTLSYENSSMIPVINVSEDYEGGGHASMLPPPRSPDLSRTEVSPTVPSCKVTPLVDNDDTMYRPKTPESSALSNNSAELDWSLMDPDLLQHCRTTNPVLRKDKYWV